MGFRGGALSSNSLGFKVTIENRPEAQICLEIYGKVILYQVRTLRFAVGNQILVENLSLMFHTKNFC
jgi:DNA mismatch repair ATPase MutL